MIQKIRLTHDMTFTIPAGTEFTPKSGEPRMDGVKTVSHYRTIDLAPGYYELVEKPTIETPVGDLKIDELYTVTFRARRGARTMTLRGYRPTRLFSYGAIAFRAPSGQSVRHVDIAWLLSIEPFVE